MGLKKALGFSAMFGARRDLDELLEEKQMIHEAVRDKHRDWKEQQADLPRVERRIKELQAKVAKED